MEDFRSRGAPLGYWFTKVSSGDLAFLVDWVVRRDSARAEVRISMWVRRIGGCKPKRCVARGRHRGRDLWMHTHAGARHRGTRDVRWDLVCAPGPWVLQPARCWPGCCTRLIWDSSLAPEHASAAPSPWAAKHSGSMTRLARGPLLGSPPTGRLAVGVCGWRQENDAAVEAALFHSRLWGAPKPAVTAGYVAVIDRGRTAQIIAPVYGRVTARGNETAFEIRAHSWGRSMHLTARSPRATYNDLGEGIRQTLLGDLTVDGWGSCSGQAGLEIRGDAITVEDRGALKAMLG